MNRVSTAALQNFTLANLQATQARIANRSIQLNTGKLGQRFADIPQDAKRLVNLESARLRANQFVQNNELIDRRLQTMETNLGQMFEIATRLRTLLVQANSGGQASVMDLNGEANALLQQVAALLNVNQDGRYLFAGSKTDVAPVDLNAAGFNPPATASTADTLYYQGDTQKLSVRSGDNMSLTYGITADDPAIEQLIRALHLAATTTTSPVPDDARLTEGLRIADLVVQDLPPLISRIGSARATLEVATRAHTESILYAEETIGKLENVDVTEAITVISGDQITLEASFAALAQIRNVSLLQYL